MSIIACRPRILTPERELLAVRRSLEVNPANESMMATVERSQPGRRGSRRLALVVGTRWPESGVRLSVQFLDNAPKNLRKRLLLHMNAWSKTANILFQETKETGHVRISRSDDPKWEGYWSWVGTQILAIDDMDEPTMNLQGFTMDTPEREFLRVVRHEAGHTLGFDHEHLRSDLVKKIDVKKAIAYYQATNGWSAAVTKTQVLTPLKNKSIMGTTEVDGTSIMCYHVPGEITKDGHPIPGGLDINENDFQFAGEMYPKTGTEPQPPSTATYAGAATDASSASFPSGMSLSSPNHDSRAGLPETTPTRYEGQQRSTFEDGEVDTFHLVIMDEFDPEGIRLKLLDYQAQLVPYSVGGTPKKKPANSAESPTEKPKFARIFATYGGARVSCAMRLRSDPGEEPTPFGRIIHIHSRIKSYTNREEGQLPDDKKMKEFGTDLFDALFHGDVKRLYDEARSRQRQRKLDLVFTSMIPWIAEKPWEFAYDKVRDSFLATEEVHLIRNVITAIPANIITLQRGPLRILVASAQPVGFGHLSIDQEVSVIARGFQALEEAGAVTIKVLPHATPSLLHGELATGAYNIVHFIGHGTFDDDEDGKGQGALIFENDRGGSYKLGERSVREIFCQRGISLVFLNSCQSGSGGQADFNKGLAQSLVRHGLPALVANQYSVLDSSASSFAQHFYWALAQGMTIGQAAREARIAVNYSLMGEPIDWAVPVVYARDPNKPLCVQPAKVNPVPATSVRRSTLRSIQSRPIRVAFWDIDNVFPALEETLDHMNEVQQVFGFELVALSAPVDSWELEEKSDRKSKLFLRADKVAERLKRATIDLRVDILACITRHWMCDETQKDIYGWWPDNRETPVVMFSAAGLDDLPPEGPLTDQLIANNMVLLIAGYYSRMDTHVGGDKTCPLYRNSKRDFKHMVSHLTFDTHCRASLQKALIEEFPKANVLDALETLLSTFHKV